VKGRFEAVVLGDALPRGKPDPLPYRIAGEGLGAACRDGIAFEDWLSGARSGAFAIGVLSNLPEAELVDAGTRFGIKNLADPRPGPLIGTIVLRREPGNEKGGPSRPNH
jgi:beta-phosphoglucomutase-like phosphatase (HAD superfamily)